ncbi:MAG: hypothetical protein U5L10_02390 [Candidatus Moranbacteria bacterium]|nr:hypothetical protein [Candidatus Moranbacteria bacterium]
MKNVLISVPVKGEGGFLEETAVGRLEQLLSESGDINFLGNINLKDCTLRNGEIFKKGELIKKPDLIFWYGKGMLKYWNLLKALSLESRVIKNPDSSKIVSSKFLAHSLLKKHGLPVADFALVDYLDFDSMKKILKEWGAVLIKPQDGSFGRGIIKVEDFEIFRDIAGMLKLENKQQKILVEKFYPNKAKDWISTTVIGGEVVYGYRKNEEKFENWKVFDPIAKGGNAHYVDPAPVRKLAEKAAGCLGAEIVGFDFIKTEKGYILVDENNFPGLYDEAFSAVNKSPEKLMCKMIKQEAIPDR